ncbi:MAG: polyprenyl synthetase family protein [Phycisphaerales bacterium]
MKGLLDISPELAPVAELIAAGLVRVVHVFDRALLTDLPPVEQLCRHVESYRGKMLRPALVMVCGAAAHPRAGRAPLGSLLSGAHDVLGAVVEMVHMATLVHDDVLDEADMRRRGQTVNRLHGNETAVMLGDFLIASAFHLCSTLDSQRYSLAVGRASAVLCAGELLQLHHREDFSLDEPTYFELVDRKTAELIACACEIGAAASGAPDEAVAACERFGRRVGVAFQIQDDVLDLTGSVATVGKSVGKDLEKGKATLPLIHHLASAEPSLRGRTLMLLEAAANDQGAAGQVRAALESTGSLAYAKQVAGRLVEEAKTAAMTLQPSEARAMLLAMADAVITREH